MNQSFKLSALSLILAPLSFSTLAYVSPEVIADTNKTSQIERLTVTSNRKEMLDTDLAMSVHGIGQDELNIDNGQHVAESLNSISGVLVNQLSGGQGHQTAIRMPMNTSGYYLFLQDNIPLQSPAFFNHNGLWWSSFNSNVSRMEVLKGAGTALYGSGAVAATINILSKPIADETETSLGVTLGEDDYGKVQASHSQKIDSKNAIRVSASYLNNGGWRDHTGSKRGEINIRHEYNIANNETLATSFIASDLEQEMAGSLTDDLYANDRTNSGLSEAVLNNDPLRKTQYMRLSTQWDKSSGDAFYSLIPYARYRTNNYTATWNKNMPAIESNVLTLGLLGLANFEHDSNSETTVGFDAEYTNGDQFSYQPLDFTTTGWGADTFVKGEKFYDDTTTYTGISPYVQHTRHLSEKIVLTVGARFDYATYDFDNKLGVYGDIGHGNWSIEDTDDSFTHLSPKASINYNIDANSSTYFRYANSFRLPTAGSLFHLTAKDNGVAQSVDPEVSDTFEIGYKANFEQVTFDAAIYYMDVDDGIVHAYKANGQRYLTNASRVIHKGIEFAVDWQVTDTFDMSVTYTKSKHEFDEFIDASGNDLSGNKMQSAPEYIANVRFRYSPETLSELSTMLEVQSIGEYWLDDANSTDPATNKARTNNGYTVANLKAYYQVSPQLTLNARVLNLTNKAYIQEIEYTYGRNSISAGAPRTLYVGFNYNW